MSTFATLISDTERHLLAGDRDAINVLAADISPTDTTITFTYDNGMIQPGAYIALDLEVIYVTVTNDSAKQATVIRGMVGSVAAAHTAGSVVYVNPKFSKYDIANALNMEIRDLSAPPNGLFQPKNYTATTFPVRRTYAIPALNTDLLGILEVRYHEPGAEFAWIRMSRYDFTVLRKMPTDVTNGDGFANNMAVRIDRNMYPGRTLNIVYAAPFSELVNLADDVVTTTGLPVSAIDIPPLGAAARLMGVREAKRTFVESEPDSRRAGEVPVGSASKAAATLLSLLNERIKTELMRLLSQFPEMR